MVLPLYVVLVSSLEKVLFTMLKQFLLSLVECYVLGFALFGSHMLYLGKFNLLNLKQLLLSLLLGRIITR